MARSNVTILGSVISGVLKAMLSPDVTLKDFARYDECKSVDPNKPAPLDLYLDLVAFISAKLSKQVIIKLGRSVGKEVVRESLSKMSLQSPADALRAIQAAHEHFCKPTVGEFRVTDERANSLRLRYTAPYDCVLQEGLFIEIAQTYGGGLAQVQHLECRRTGAAACLFDIAYK